MIKMLSILVFALCLSATQILAQNIVSQTSVIDGAGLKKLLPNAENKKAVLINFWATWCPPCRAEFPDLVKIDADYRSKGLIFNIVSVDEVALIDNLVPAFLQNYKSTMPSYLLDLPSRRESAKAIRQIAPMFRDLYPLTLLFDKNGKLSYQKTGKINPKILRNEIDKILRK